MECSTLEIARAEEYIGYTLDEKALSMLEYKVLMNLEQGGVLPAFRVKRNGRLQLVYLIPEGFHTLESLTYSLEPDVLLHAMAAIDKVCAQIEENGFLKFEHLDMNPDHMVLNIHTGSLQMIYLPVSMGMETAILGRDNVLRELFQKLAAGNGHGETAPGLRQLRMDLADGHMEFWQIAERIRAGTYGETRRFDGKEAVPEAASPQPARANPYLVILENQARLEVNKAKYVIGKNQEIVDGVIYNHNTVSRMHCAILTEGGCCYIQDLGSKNGTFVNGQYVSAGSRVRLRNGDRIRLAECDLIFYEG